MVRGTRALSRKVVRDLWHMRSQLVAVAAVMACGIAMFVTLRSMYGWLRVTKEAYYSEYRFADVFASVRSAPISLAGEIERLPGVSGVHTRIVHDVTVDLPGLEEPGTGRLVSIAEERRPVLNDLHLKRGRWIDGNDPQEVVVSDAFARENALAPGDSVSAVINGRWQQLHIVGTALSPEYVYEIQGAASLFPDNRRFGVIWMGERTLAAAFRMTGAFNDLSITLAPGADEADVVAAVDKVIAPYGGMGAYGRADHLSDLFLTGEIDETAVTSALIPAIFLGVTAFLLNMVLARLVATQRDQIAVLKAFGYHNRTIATHYFQLALGPVLVGTAIGAVVGIWLAGALARIYGRFFQFPDVTYHQDWSVVVAAFAVAGGAALLGAMLSVRRAVRLPPAEAMRPELPASYHAGLLEQLGIARLVSPVGRIILRGLGRRPVRSGLSVLGIALATAIVMTAWFMFGALDRMLEIQFEVVQRGDVTVAFDGPRPAEARWALAGIPGVRAVEPYRAVPVRLSHAHRSLRTAVTGLAPGAELQRVVDRDMAIREVPRSGVILSDVLAGKLGVRAGDTVTMSILEGNRTRQPVVVTAVSSDLLGSAATMRLGALHALLGEAGSLSGAYLSVDEALATQVYRTLQHTPAVAGVVVRQSVIRGFEQTIAESFMISLTMMMGFASLIAAGVVYNGARVALSERGREVASLRVLGFTRGEATSILLGEQVVILVLGLPFGLLLGWGLAWLVCYRFESDLFRIPLVIESSTIGWSLVVVIASSILSALAVRRRIHHLDLVAVLKTRE